jgi:predicted ATPase
VYSLLGDRKISDLADLPEITDKRYLAVITMLNKSLTAGFFLNVDLMLYFAAKASSLSIMYGNCSNSCYPYITFGWLERKKYNTFKNCCEWGEMSMKLTEKYTQEKCLLRIGVWGVWGSNSSFFLNSRDY